MTSFHKHRRVAAVCAALALTAGAGAAYAESRPAAPHSSGPVSAGPATAPAKVSFNVVSDVQGDLTDFGRALDQMKVTNPNSGALVVNGDITPRGYKSEYDQVKQVLNTRPHPANTFSRHREVHEVQRPHQVGRGVVQRGATDLARAA
ncbi:hypothetical protein ACWCQO_39100, partial [Streptomyces microflavus]